MNIVVIGAAGRIGTALCSDLLNHGHSIIAVDLQPPALSHEQLQFEAVDINSKQALRGLLGKLEQVHAQGDLIDTAINCAYPRNERYGRSLFDVDADDFDANINLHLGGYFRVAQSFCQLFKQQQHGHLLQLSSVYGVIAPRFEIYDDTPMTMPVEYAAIKAGVIHLTRYLASYLKGNNIRVNCISPGGIEAGQPESFLQAYNQHCCTKGMMQPEDLCGLVRFLISPEAAMINGQNVIIDDGFTL